MQPEMLAGMLFVIVMTALIGGMILLIPVSRRLGVFLESKAQDRNRVPDATLQELKRLSATVEGLEAQVHSLGDRQDFVERIIDARDREPILLKKGD